SSLLAFCVLLLSAALASAQAPERAKLEEFFEKKIRPVLAENCYKCHGPQKQQAGLRLDQRDIVLKGGDGDPVVIAGQPEKSLLLEAVRQRGDVKMPPKGKLTDAAVADLETWIKLGAGWPDEKAVTSAPHAPDVAAKHWAFQPVQKP